MSQSPPFRDRALQHYKKQQEQKEVIPRYVSLRFAAILWMTLALLLVAVVVSFLVQIPSFVTSSGVVLNNQNGKVHQAGIFVFVPANQANMLQVGAPVQIHEGTGGPQFTASVESINTTVVSPANARQSFNLGSEASGVITEPSVVVTVKTPPDFSLQNNAGSVVSAQIQAGMSPVLSLLPVFNSLMGGKQ
jgi:hypothetical protein